MADYWVIETPERAWGIRRAGAARYSEVHDRPDHAITRGLGLVRDSGGGELIVQRRDGETGMDEAVPVEKGSDLTWG